MNVAAWVVQGALAAFYPVARCMKTLITNILQRQAIFLGRKDRSKGFVRFLSTAVHRGALGVVLPLLTGIPRLPWIIKEKHHEHET